jgi:ketosteroid isomerase-like protein
MAKTFVFLAALCAMLGCMSNPSVADETAAVTARVEQLRGLMVTPDAAKLADLIAEQLSYSHSDGHINDKNSLINDLVTGVSHFITLSLTEQTVAVSGDVAIVRHVLTADSHDKGKDPTHPYLRVLQIWQKQHGKWMLLARASNPIPVK